MATDRIVRRLLPTAVVSVAFTLFIIQIGTAQSFEWYDMLRTNVEPDGRYIIDDIVPLDIGVVIAGRYLGSPENHAFFTTYDRDGERLQTTEFPSYSDPAAFPVPGYNLDLVKVVPIESGGYRVWVHHVNPRTTTPMPSVAVRYRVDSEGEVQDIDTLGLSYIYSSQFFRHMEDGSIQTSFGGVQEGEEGPYIATTLWSGDLKSPDSVALPMSRLGENAAEEYFVVKEVTTRDRFLILLSNPFTYRSAIVGYDRDRGSMQVISFDEEQLHGQDLHVLPNDDILYLAREVSWLTGRSTRLTLMVIESDGLPRVLQTIEAAPDSEAEICGVAGDGRITLSWQEGRRTIIALVSPRGGVAGQTDVYGITDGTIVLAPNGDHYVQWGQIALGRLAMGSLSTVHETGPFTSEMLLLR